MENSRTWTKQVHLDKTNELINLVQSYVFCMLKWTSSYILNELSKVWFIVFYILYCGYRRCHRRRDDRSFCARISHEFVKCACSVWVGGSCADGIKRMLNSRDNAATCEFASLMIRRVYVLRQPTGTPLPPFSREMRTTVDIRLHYNDIRLK